MTIALYWFLALVTLMTFDVLFRKLFGKKFVHAVVSKVTDDGENISMQFSIPDNLPSKDKFLLINEQITALESRREFVDERFKKRLEEERAKQESGAKLKSV